MPAGAADLDVQTLLRELPRRVSTWHEPPRLVRALSGGITNRNYLIEAGGARFVLRVGCENAAALGIDRRCEYEANRMAAEAGVAPEVVGYLEPEGYLVTRYVEGEPVAPERVRSPELLPRVVDAVRRVHAGRPIPGTFSPFRTVAAYAETVRRAGGALPQEVGWLLQQAERIRAALGEPQPRPCHNDLLPANFILAQGRIVILDWEYAGMGDPFFDLGNLAANNGFGEREEQELLRRYFGTVTPQAWARLKLMRIMSDFREAMWGFVQRVSSQLDFDFAGYAQHHLDRALAAARAPGFETWLREAAQA